MFEPVRSAEPPIVSGITGLIAASAISLALRVATLGCSAETCRFSARIAPASFFGGSPKRLMAALLDDEAVTPDVARELRDLLAETEGDADDDADR